MNATKEITSILSAMGAKPIAKTTENGTIMKVNAPILNKKKSFEICCSRCTELATIVTKQGFKCLNCGFFVSLDEMITETKT